MDSNTLQSTVSKSWVGTLVQWDPFTNSESNPLELYSESEVFIGRNAKTCQYHLSNRFVSNKHVRIYTVLYDESGLEVPPLVYAEDFSLNVTRWNGFPMGNSSGSFLLSDGDVLTIVPDVYVRYHSTGWEGDDQITSIQRSEMRAFSSYEVTPRVLGFGAYGRVHMAFKKDSGQQLACKIIDLVAFKHRVLKDLGDDEESRSLSGPQAMVDSPNRGAVQKPHPKGALAEEKVACFRREARILAAMSHPNIVSLERVFQSSRTMYIFSELVTGGDLYSFIRSQQARLDDQTSAFIIRQVLLAVNYLHDQNVMHRDIKPDNILLTSPTEGGRVVLSDFGCARKFDPSTRRKYSVVGTPEYCAPEISSLRQVGYTKAADLWSVGCVTAILLTGSPAFDGKSDHIAQELVELKKSLKDLEVDEWPSDFVLKLLVRNVHKRLTAKEALNHFWINNPGVRSRCHAAIEHWTRKQLEKPEVVDLEGPGILDDHQPSVSESTGAPEKEQDHSIDHISESSCGDPPEGDTLHPSLTCQTPGQDFSKSTTPPERNLHPPDPPSENASPRTSWTPRESPPGKEDPEFLSDIKKLASPKPGMLVQMAIQRHPEAKAPLRPESPALQVNETGMSMRFSLFDTSPGLKVNSLEDPFLSPESIKIPTVRQPNETSLPPRPSLFGTSPGFEIDSLENPFLSPGSINIPPVLQPTEPSLLQRLSLFDASPGLKVDLLQNPFLTPGSINRPPSTSPMRKHARSAEGKDTTDDVEQVYEVVHNPMTGKRTRRIYGQDVEDLEDLQS